MQAGQNEAQSCWPPGSECVRLTWGHRGQRSLDTKVKSSILETRIQGDPCKAWDWLVSEVQTRRPLAYCEGCSRALGSGTLGNAAGNLAQ